MRILVVLKESVIFSSVLLPALFIFFAVFSAAWVCFGTEPVWASYDRHGIELILWSRRLQWPLIFTAILLCVSLVAFIIANKRRLWWLVGLIPVLLLFYHRMTHGPVAGLRCAQDLPMESTSLNGQDMVVGLILDKQPCAIPFATLAIDPVIIYSGREKSVVIFWSAMANRAMAFAASRDLHAADLEIISTPNNALLVYNSRLGEFINGITGQTPRGQIPIGLLQPLIVTKCTWNCWLLNHADSKVMTGGISTGGFPQPQKPEFPLPGMDLKPAQRICLVDAAQPIAVISSAISDRPLNLMAGKTALLLVKINGIVHAYNRELPAELIPRFLPATDAKDNLVAWGDTDTSSQWSNDGQWITGDPQLRGTALKQIPVDDDLDWNLVKYWFPDIHLVTEVELIAAVAQPLQKTSENSAAVKRRKLPRH